MGTSFVVFRDKGFWLNDGHLELLLHLLANEVDRLGESASPWLREARAHWRLQSGIQATGCVDPGLDVFLTGPERVAIALELAAKTRQSILNRTAPFSEEKAVGELGRAISLMGDVPKTWVAQGVEALIKLLKNELLPADGRLVLPKLEYYSLVYVPRIVPQDPTLQAVGELWLALERERFAPEAGESVLDRLMQDPWTSTCPRIRRAWRELTAPENLRALERWAKRIGEDPEMARHAGDWAEKAVESAKALRP